ncbi:TlyA family RNA methyltransferase [Spiroplasma floricola]|uniref:23S rRNA (Cytidine1920-2'-O)/16S rRNA (Cytidine1409-2'-O)-methyltransferase n=1 Tax=Spiroplasma floricola 23-6 TaxID=1336749 RepID=A0A2K8SDX3_9MOLU|nr:TlyA family RNA methyltransferase [Spiroplasma floricola]AUB31651.1 23S rRNA (cytidine1920-2'-O)/16S rRNA (cytidine1409-2'-O)-methyltransferase [Spiroplasma floricola 23-6]
MKQRLDQILLKKELAENRNKARGLIIDGKVLVNNEKITKPGTLFDQEKINIKLLNQENEFVSRAGKKLFKAINFWKINLEDKVCLDIGSSTGGFTDCCLQHGAQFVYAVDVGTNQLDWKIRNNIKVKSMEKTNFRNVTKDFFDKEINFFCCDVSFISVEKILTPLKEIVSDNVLGIILIKPQFESDKEDVKNGKINSKEGHIKSINRVTSYCNQNSFSVIDINWSPILGNKKKNIEYLCLIKKTSQIKNQFDQNEIPNLVNNCWKFFENNYEE